LVELKGMLFTGTIGGRDGGPDAQVETAFSNFGKLLIEAGAASDNLGLVTIGTPS
jgi:hypothetical protein